MPETLYSQSDNWFRVLGVTNEKTGAYLNGSVTIRVLTLKDRTGAQVSGFPVTLGYIALSNGDYEVLLPRTLAVVAGQSYTADVEIDGGAGLYRRMQETVRVVH